jgi:hypothetical protein
MTIVATWLPLPGGERTEERGLLVCGYSRLPNPLTLPSPRRGEEEGA